MSPSTNTTSRDGSPGEKGLVPCTFHLRPAQAEWIHQQAERREGSVDELMRKVMRHVQETLEDVPSVPEQSGAGDKGPNIFTGAKKAGGSDEDAESGTAESGEAEGAQKQATDAHSSESTLDQLRRAKETLDGLQSNGPSEATDVNASDDRQTGGGDDHRRKGTEGGNGSLFPASHASDNRSSTKRDRPLSERSFGESPLEESPLGTDSSGKSTSEEQSSNGACNEDGEPESEQSEDPPSMFDLAEPA